jgi:hypothetical protein
MNEQQAEVGLRRGRVPDKVVSNIAPPPAVVGCVYVGIGRYAMRITAVQL